MATEQLRRLEDKLDATIKAVGELTTLLANRLTLLNAKRPVGAL